MAAAAADLWRRSRRFPVDRIEDILFDKEMPGRGYRAERPRDFRDG